MSNYKTNFMKEYNDICKDYTYTPFIIEPVERIVVFGDIHGDYKMAVKLLLMSGVAKIVETVNDTNSGNKEDDNISLDNISCDSKDSECEELKGKLVEHKNFKIRSDVTYKMKWIGGKTYVVQVGDQVDRCRVYGNMTCELPETTLDDEHSDIKILKLFTDLHEQAVKESGAVISLLGNHEINNALGNMSYVSAKGVNGFKNYRRSCNWCKIQEWYGRSYTCISTR